MLSQFCLAFSFLLFASQFLENDIDGFLDKSAVEVDSLEFSSNINKFLNYQVDKEKGPVWFKGNILTESEQVFNDLSLNFNVLDNSLYVFHDNHIYRISNSILKSFDIDQNGKEMKFCKGYAIPFDADMTGNFNGASHELLTYITSYPAFSDFQVKKITTTESSKTAFKIIVSSRSRNEISGLINYLKSNARVKDFNSAYAASELNKAKYMQVLFEDENFQILKFHFKRNATAETVSVIKNSSSFVFDDEDYYIADSKKRLQEFIFTKRSIKNGLSSIRISYSKKLRGLKNENRVIDWFESNTFSLNN